MRAAFSASTSIHASVRGNAPARYAVMRRPGTPECGGWVDAPAVPRRTSYGAASAVIAPEACAHARASRGRAGPAIRTARVPRWWCVSCSGGRWRHSPAPPCASETLTRGRDTWAALNPGWRMPKAGTASWRASQREERGFRTQTGDYSSSGKVGSSWQRWREGADANRQSVRSPSVSPLSSTMFPSGSVM